MSPPFRTLALDHVVLRCADPARMERFYTDVLGSVVERRLDAAVKAADLAQAQHLWQTLGAAYLVAMIIFIAVALIGLLKPSFGQAQV